MKSIAAAAARRWIAWPGGPTCGCWPSVPGDQVASYVRAFDLGLLPYRLTQETHHASPLKLYEYLAAGLPVVAADVPGARQFADVVAIADATCPPGRPASQLSLRPTRRR